MRIGWALATCLVLCAVVFWTFTKSESDAERSLATRAAAIPEASPIASSSSDRAPGGSTQRDRRHGDPAAVSVAPHLTMRLHDGSQHITDCADVVLVSSRRRIPFRFDRASAVYRSETVTGAGSGKIVLPGFLPASVRWPGGDQEQALGVVHVVRGGTLKVTLVDPGGRDVAKVSVNRYGGPGSHSHGNQITDGEGTATFTGLVPGRHYVHINGDDRYVADGEDVDVGPGVTELVLVLMPTATVSGRILDSEGRPVEDGTFHVWTSSGHESSARTDSAGRFRATLIRAGVQLEATVASGALQRAITVAPLSEGEERELGDLLLPRGARLHGVVVDEANVPVPQASVRCYPVQYDGAFGDLHELSTQTTYDGRFQFDGLATRHYRLSVGHDGHVSSTRLVETSVANDDPVQVVLVRGSTQAISVRTPRGLPVEGARVTVISLVDARERTTRTGKDGSFTIRDFRPGPARITVEKGMLEADFELESWAHAPGDLVFSGGGSLEVSLGFGGDPSPSKLHLELRNPDDRSVFSESVESDAGVYHAAFLQPGQYTLTIRAPGFLPVFDQPVSIHTDRTTRRTVDLEPRAAAEVVTVSVTDHLGQPVPGATVYLRNLHVGFADGVGELEIRLSPDSESQLAVRRWGFGFYAVDDAYRRVRDGVLRVTLPRPSRVTAHFDYPPGDHKEAISVRLAPVDLRLSTTLRSALQHGHAYLIRWHDFDGQVEGDQCLWRDVAPGEYELLAYVGWCPIYRQRLVIREATEREIAIPVPRAFRVTGTVLDDGKPVDGGSLSVRAEVRDGDVYAFVHVGPAGQFSLWLRCPGEYSLHYWQFRNALLDSWFTRHLDGASQLRLQIKR